MFLISKVDFVRPASTRGYQQSTVVICREYTSGRYMYYGLHFSAVPLYSLSKIRIQLELTRINNIFIYARQVQY